MQKCYNCGKEVEDNVLICPECGALVKRYTRPEPAQPETPFPQADTAAAPPHSAVWQQETGKLRFRGYLTFWLVLCAIFLAYTLFGFVCMLLIVRFQDIYFEVLGQDPDFAVIADLVRILIDGVAQYPAYYLAFGVLVLVQFGCVIWFLASKRKLALFLLTGAAAVLCVIQLIMGGGISSIIYPLGPAVTWLLLRSCWRQLR